MDVSKKYSSEHGMKVQDGSLETWDEMMPRASEGILTESENDRKNRVASG